MSEGYSEATSFAHGLLLEAETPEEADRSIRKMLAEWRILAIEAIKIMLACTKASLAAGLTKPLYSPAALAEIVGAGA
ncbi:MAG: hypothetical protein M3R38_21790 [Actinomycetota bacterium]|nr:hypothetical protein [Actinomycetota bacterium]